MEKSKYDYKDVYKMIFESSTEGILVCNQEGEIIMINDSIEGVFGYNREELVGQKIEILLPKKLKRIHVAHRDNYARLPSKKKMGAGRDLFGLKKNGDKIPVEISLNYMTVEGDFLVVALITDISERKNQETLIHDLNAELEVKVQLRTKELKENQILYSLIAKNFPNGLICVLDKKLKIIFAEGEELNKNGLKGKFLLDKDYLDTFNKENQEEIEEKLHKAFKGKVVNFEIKKRKSVYQVHAVPLIYDEDIEVSRVLIVENNVTKTKNIEEKMKRSLEREKELGELKSQFVSMASHEFRTPLSTILSSVNLIEKYDVLGNEAKKKGHLEKIKKNIRSLTNMLNDTLTISRIEENINDVEFSLFNILELIQEVVLDADGLKVAGQEVIVQFAGKEELICDRKILKIVLGNIISNALKYSESNVVVHLSVLDKKLIIIVLDKGIGIPLADQEHLFERFYRANNSLNIQGTGLGLNIVASYIDILKGKIEIQSEETIGTNVTIEVPIDY